MSRRRCAGSPSTPLLLDLRAALLETRYIGYQFGDRNLDGREQAHAPQYQFDLGVEYHGARGLFARVDFAGLDDFYFDASHDERAPSRVLTHLKAGYSGEPLARGSLGQKPVRQVLFAAWILVSASSRRISYRLATCRREIRAMPA